MLAENKELQSFLNGKSELSLQLLEEFIKQYKKIGNISIHPAKTMIGIANSKKRIAWITQIGKNFIHVVFPFRQPYQDNLCFLKIAQVPGDGSQFNHHFRMYFKEDINEEVMQFMRLAFNEEKNIA